MSKSAWVAITIGSTAGGAVPLLWGGGPLSSLFFGSVGAFVAVWVNYSLNH